MELIPNGKPATRHQRNSPGGIALNSRCLSRGKPAGEQNGVNDGTYVDQTVLSRDLDLPNGSPLRMPVKKAPVTRPREGQGGNNDINETTIKVTPIINYSPDHKHRSFEPGSISIDILECATIKATPNRLVVATNSGNEEVTSRCRNLAKSTTTVTYRTISSFSVAGASHDVLIPVVYDKPLKGTNSQHPSSTTKNRGFEPPTHHGGTPYRKLASAERQTVHSLVSPALVDHLNHTNTLDDHPGLDGQGRSYSDVTYDALPVLEDGEIDKRSFLLTGSTSEVSKLIQDHHARNLKQVHNDGRSVSVQGGICHHDGSPLRDEQENNEHIHLRDNPKSKLKADEFEIARTAKTFIGSNQGDNIDLSLTLVSTSWKGRRNAIGDVMESLNERSLTDSFGIRADQYAVEPDETLPLRHGRPRRDTCSLNPAGTAAGPVLRFKHNVKEFASQKRRRAYSDLSGNTKNHNGKATTARKLSITSQQRLLRTQVARQKFAHAIKLVIILLRINSMVFQKKKHQHAKREPLTFMEIAEQFQSDDMKSSGLSFDPRDFRAKREINISSEAKTILNMPSYCRTPEQLQTALYGLQTMKSFAEYPLHMQEKLVKVACVPPKRVIIRQGHYAENFYFVISGSVIVTIMETKAETGEAQIRTAAVLRKGSSFGELALLHHSRRTATVASQGQVELLAIGREDFFDIFMRGQQPGEEPEHVKYLRQLVFMKHWPIERLIEHPEMCLFHFYKRGQVVVKDSNQSDWIYIVKSGSCQVLKQLDAAKRSKPVRSNSQGTCTIRLPKLHTRHLSAPELPTKRPMRTRVRNHSATTSYLQFISVPTVSTINTSTPLDIDHNLMDRNTFPGRLPETFMTRQKTAMGAKSAPSESNFSQFTFGDDSSSVTSLPNIISSGRRQLMSRESFSRSKFREIAGRNPPPTAKRMSFVPHVTVTDDHIGSESSSASETKGSVFVQVELLLPKDVFGLSTLGLDLGIDHEQSSVNLVSRGAELIMIQRDFFTKYCSDDVKRHVRSLVKPYPPPESLQHNLQNHSNWTSYKHEAVASILRDKYKTKELRL